MNVLSLFDGISCGKIALDKVGINNKYYASEIDEAAIKVSSYNYKDIIRLGDVNNWKKWDIDFSSIDLLIGGSPCQGFSMLGKKLNFEDERSKLFFVYVDILNHIKTLNPNVKFLLENVKMKKEWQDTISEYLGVQPKRINSSLLTAAKRDRLYWTNFEILPIEEKNITFDDICDFSENWLPKEYILKVAKWKAQQKPLDNVTYIGDRQKLPCLTARGYNQSHSGMILITDYNHFRYLTTLEAERAMGIPEGYVDKADISEREKSKVIGNGWSVDVIAHIFKSLK